MTTFNANGNTTGSTITVSQTPNTLNDLESADFGLTDNDQVVKPITKLARLKWLNGFPTDQQTIAVGMHIEAGINPLIDETMTGMGMTRYIVQHRTEDKDGNTEKAYWKLHPCSLIVVTRGVLSTFQMRDSTERLGLAFAKEVERDTKGEVLRYDDGKRNVKMHNVLKLRAYVQELVAHGYSEWLPLTLTGNIVECMLEALSAQFSVLEAYEQFYGRKAPFYAFSLPIVPSTKVKMVGPKDGQQSPIYPMLAQVPEVVNKDYLTRHLTPPDLITHINRELLRETVAWSVEESIKIAQDNGEESGQLAAIAQHSAGSVQDPAVGQPQIAWITQQYCHNNAAVIQATCERFSVSSIEQLRMSHFRTLVNEQRQPS